MNQRIKTTKSKGWRVDEKPDPIAGLGPNEAHNQSNE